MLCSRVTISLAHGSEPEGWTYSATDWIPIAPAVIGWRHENAILTPEVAAKKLASGCAPGW